MTDYLPNFQCYLFDVFLCSHVKRFIAKRVAVNERSESCNILSDLYVNVFFGILIRMLFCLFFRVMYIVSNNQTQFI